MFTGPNEYVSNKFYCVAQITALIYSNIVHFRMEHTKSIQVKLVYMMNWSDGSASIHLNHRGNTLLHIYLNRALWISIKCFFF